eukprot:gene10655-21529_t
MIPSILLVTVVVLGNKVPTDLHCETGHPGEPLPQAPAVLQPRAFELLPLGAVVPDGWLLNQLVIQANSLSGYLSVSTFPGADTVNTSAWTGKCGRWCA